MGLPWAPATPTSGSIAQRTESRVSKGYLHTHEHYSIIHNSQRLEATHVSTDKLQYTHTLDLLSLKKEENSNTVSNADEPSGPYTQWHNRSQHDKNCTIPPRWGTWGSLAPKDKVERMLPGAGGGEHEKCLFNGDWDWASASGLQDNMCSTDRCATIWRS